MLAHRIRIGIKAEKEKAMRRAARLAWRPPPAPRWVILFVALETLDVATTAIVQCLGGSEHNPLVRWLWTGARLHLGTSIVLASGVKAFCVVVFLALLGWLRAQGMARWMLRAAALYALALMAGVVVWNSWTLIQLARR